MVCSFRLIKLNSHNLVLFRQFSENGIFWWNYDISGNGVVTNLVIINIYVTNLVAI
jgi:hypothetical protein